MKGNPASAKAENNPSMRESLSTQLETPEQRLTFASSGTAAEKLRRLADNYYESSDEVEKLRILSTIRVVPLLGNEALVREMAFETKDDEILLALIYALRSCASYEAKRALLEIAAEIRLPRVEGAKYRPDVDLALNSAFAEIFRREDIELVEAIAQRRTLQPRMDRIIRLLTEKMKQFP